MYLALGSGLLKNIHWTVVHLKLQPITVLEFPAFSTCQRRHHIWIIFEKETLDASLDFCPDLRQGEMDHCYACLAISISISTAFGHCCCLLSLASPLLLHTDDCRNGLSVGINMCTWVRTCQIKEGKQPEKPTPVSGWETWQLLGGMARQKSRESQLRTCR